MQPPPSPVIPSSGEHDPRATRDRILDAAETLFAERGFDGVAVRDIAARVGLNAASLYNHFPGKQALYEAVLERGLAPLLALVGRIAERGAATEDADQIIATLMAQLGHTPQLPRLIQHEAVRGAENLSQLARRFIRPLFVQGTAAMKQSPDTRHWPESELPLVIAGFMHLLFGHFAMAPLLADVLDEDPLSPEVLARQTRFLQKLTRLLVTPPPKDPKE
ncbi:MAG TPA: TetR/AcrR family transcriptional regulator [Myxococcota bacterium]|jgi:AcrR family transcriptional regulator|nr:TetR/AcrR family transcriptional regulator [Myxococcota bacterium]